MSFFFKRSPKTPSELVKALNEQVVKLDFGSDNNKKTQDDATRYLTQVKILLCGGDDEMMGNLENQYSSIPHPDQIAQVANEIYSSDCLLILVQNLGLLENDSRNMVVELFSTLLMRSPTIDYLLKKPKLLLYLMRGPEYPEVSLYFGSMLRNAIKNDQITRYLLNVPAFWKYFEYIQQTRFEHSTNAFNTLNDLLTIHKRVVAEFFQENADLFSQKINLLISSNSYVAKRQSIKLLSQLLLQKSNYYLLTSYVNSPQNLKTIMVLLGDKSKNIQMESFHVFKVFIANPKKTKPVTDILIKNREKLLNFLGGFVMDKKDDGAFINEKSFVIDQIEKLPKIIPNNPSSTNLGQFTNISNYSTFQQPQLQQENPDVNGYQGSSLGLQQQHSPVLQNSNQQQPNSSQIPRKL